MARVHVTVPGRGILLVVLLVLGGAGILVAVTLFPHAAITVHPKITTKQLSKDILLSAKNETPDYVRFTLPAKIVEEEIDTAKTFENTGGVATQDFSKGSITFTNTQDQEQRLLPKTQMRHIDSGLIFLIDTPVAIPAKGTLTVSVTAKEKGPAGDVAPGKFVVEKFTGGLQQAVTAQSDKAFSGGESTDTVISQEAIDTAQKTVLEQAKQDALAKLTAKAGGASIRPDLVTVEVLSQNVSASAGSRAVRYVVQAKVKARGFVVDTHDLISLMTLALRATVASDEEFLSYDVNSFALTIAQTDWKTGQARVSASLTGKYAKKIGPNELQADNLSGLSAKEINDRFTTSPNIGSVDVSLTPFWVRSAPSKENQIDIRVGEAR